MAGSKQRNCVFLSQDAEAGVPESCRRVWAAGQIESEGHNQAPQHPQNRRFPSEGQVQEAYRCREAP